jgi:hypothetical protein
LFENTCWHLLIAASTEGLLKKNSTILFIGNSHTRSISDAYRKEPNLLPADVTLDVNWLIGEKTKAGKRGPLGDTSLSKAIEKLKRLRKSDVAVLSLLGTSHNIIGLLRHDAPFDVLSSGSQDGSKDQIIPNGVMSSYFNYLFETNKTIPKLVAASNAQIFHLATPPTKESNSFIEARITQYHDQVASEVGINSAGTRLRLWQLEMDALAKACVGWGMGFVPVPEGAATANGFLKSEYYANDATHSNAAYGALVIRQVKGLMKPVSKKREIRAR